MGIRKQLCWMAKDRKEDLSLTYDALVEMSTLNKSQLIRVFCNEGEGVSLEKIESLLDCLGVKTEIAFLFTEEIEFWDDICNS